MSNTKIVYQTDADGVYIGETIAHESPRQPGVFLIPAGCVEAAPPALNANRAALWVDGKWIVAFDYRGNTWYRDSDPVVIDFVGDPATRGLTTTAPVPTRDDLKADKLTAIGVAAGDLLLAGAPVGSTLHVSLDDGSRADLTAMAATATAAASGAVAWPDSYSRGWITIENVRVPLPTPAAGLTLAASVGDYYAAIIQHRRDLKDAALAAETVDELDAIDVSAGWPARKG